MWSSLKLLVNVLLLVSTVAVKCTLEFLDTLGHLDVDGDLVPLRNHTVGKEMVSKICLGNRRLHQV